MSKPPLYLLYYWPNFILAENAQQRPHRLYVLLFICRGKAANHTCCTIYQYVLGIKSYIVAYFSY